MKKNLLIIAAVTFVAGTVLLSSCKKEDTTAPTVTLVGDDETISLNSSYSEQGATAEDNKDGDITTKISITGSVDEDMTGTYTITYSATDAAGNTGTAERKVTVKNDAEAWAGTYAVKDSINPSLIYNYSQIVSVSSTVNNRLTFNKFADYSNNTGIYAGVTGNSITLTSQTATGIGSLSESHSFAGTGMKISNGFTLTYTDVNNSAGGASTTCYARFTK